jgi:hypothetical protein
MASAPPAAASPAPAAAAPEAALQVTPPPGATGPASGEEHFDATAAVPPPDAKPSPTLSLRLEPSWGYRRFLDTEPSTTDKRFGTPGVFLVGARAELYPLARSEGILRDVGLTGSYFRALAISVTDFDSDTPVGATWYSYSAGIRLRLLGRTGTFALGLFGGYERWSFTFDSPADPAREIPTADYKLVGGGVDGRQSLGRFSLFAEAAYLQPLSVASLGDRNPQTRAYGARGALGVAFRVTGGMEIDAHATYTLVRLSLEPLAGRADQPGRVSDQYLVSTLGLRFSL